ncbi:MAG TPA: class I SAM-dependent rRNA methyltransferase [Gemmatimonadales bacterium]|jgi:23S rRNA (cytosine1962-C5)-methyltransferase|nr:class I SAM-dependent rRNA methyltransferase [Gemmatimonadales bacterium]
MPWATVSARGAARWSAGHPWIYRSDVIDAPDEAGIVSVRDNSRGRFIGQALCSPSSEIRLRLLERSDRTVDGAWWREHLAGCRDRRAVIDATAWRAVHAEGDALPALIVDRYDRWLVVQLLSAALEPSRADIIAALRDVFGSDGILLRHDVPARRLEKLPETVELAWGSVPEQIEVREGTVRWLAAPWTGQKTGGFLDQRENRLLAAALVPVDGTALDCFSYHGSFALHLAQRASAVVALDSSVEALERGAVNAALNELTNIEFVAADAFDILPRWSREGRRFDVVVVDPPAFAKSRSHVAAALRGYHEINRRALRLVAPGGSLVTASCSFHVKRPEFLDMLANAAADSGRRATLTRILGQAEDHPEVISIPETGYLKGAILRVD